MPAHTKPATAKATPAIAVIGIDIGKNVFHLIGLDKRGAIALKVKLSRGQLMARLANLGPCLIGMEACVGAHHLSRLLIALGHDARLMPAKYVKAFLKGNKNDFRDAEAIAEAVQRPTMRLVATKTAEQLDLQALQGCRLWASDDGAGHWPNHLERDGGYDRRRRHVDEGPRLRRLARHRAQTDLDRGPHDSRQDLQAREQVLAHAVRAGRPCRSP
jgi:hypothetical protein